MNNMLAQRPVVSRPAAPSSNLPLRRRKALEDLLQQAAGTDGDALYPLLAMLLDLHMDRGHLDADANARIRDGLDQLELLLALEIERLGLRHAPETARMHIAPVCRHGMR